MYSTCKQASAPLLILALISTLILLSGCSRQSAEEKGTAMATEKLDIAKGMGDAMTSKGESAGEAIATGIGKVFDGAGKGIANSGRKIVPDASLGAAGLSVTTVQDAEADALAKSPHGLNAYVVAAASARGTMRVLVYDIVGKEIGRTHVQLTRDVDAAGYVFFPLDSLVRKQDIKRVVFKFEPAEQQTKG